MNFSDPLMQSRLVNPRKAQRGAILLDPAGYLWVAVSEIFVMGCGDSEPRLITELGHGGEWVLIAAPGETAHLPDHEIFAEAPEVQCVLSGIDSAGWPVMWEETNYYHGQNTREWFAVGSEEQIPVDEVRYPIRCWRVG